MTMALISMRYVIAALILGLITSGFIYFKKIERQEKCNTDFVHDLCKQHYENKTVGDICSKICSNSDTLKCLSNREEKKVFEIRSDNESMIMKFDHKWYQNINEQEHNTAHNFQEFINKILNSNVPGNNWWRTFDFKMFHDTVTKQQFLALMSLPEPFWMSLYGGRNWALRFMGMCGGVYAVEKVEYTATDVFTTTDLIVDMIGLTFQGFDSWDIQHFDDTFENILPEDWLLKIHDFLDYIQQKLYRWVQQTRQPSFSERVVFAEEALKMVDGINKDSDGQLQICDFHLGNLGFTVDKKVKLIDFDLLVKKRSLKKYLSDIRNCTSSRDCKFGYLLDDCSSECMLNNNTCTDEIRHGNLQNLCQSFFVLFRNIERDFKKSVENRLKVILDTCKQLENTRMTLEAERKGVINLLSLFQQLKSEYSTNSQ